MDVLVKITVACDEDSVRKPTSRFSKCYLIQLAMTLVRQKILQRVGNVVLEGVQFSRSGDWRWFRAPSRLMRRFS